jgi:hypothetical protein
MVESNQSLVHIRLNRRRLLLPLDRHFSLESLSELDVANNGLALGYVDQPQGRYPVYQIDDQWRLLSALDNASSHTQLSILQMQVEGYRFGIVCCDLMILARKDVELLRLPQAMCTVDGLVSQVWINQQQAVGLVFPVDLYHYLIALGATEIDAGQEPGVLASGITLQTSLFEGAGNVSASG